MAIVVITQVESNPNQKIGLPYVDAMLSAKLAAVRCRPRSHASSTVPVIPTNTFLPSALPVLSLLSLSSVFDTQTEFCSTYNPVAKILRVSKPIVRRMQLDYTINNVDK